MYWVGSHSEAAKNNALTKIPGRLFLPGNKFIVNDIRNLT